MCSATGPFHHTSTPVLKTFIQRLEFVLWLVLGVDT